MMATEDTDPIYCKYGKKLTPSGQHCLVSLIGCVKTCKYRPDRIDLPAKPARDEWHPTAMDD